MDRAVRRFGTLFWVLVASTAGLLTPSPTKAQHITIDGTLTPAQTLNGPTYTIGANLGKQVGSNLFQSFGIFGLNSSESATFTGPGNVSNIIGRVTGGTPSSIDGKVQSTIAAANLYLINPSGIVFGPNATVNVSGSFHSSTADYLRMSDGAKFQARNPSGSTLSAASPAAFGFLNARPAAITVNGSSLAVPGGQTLGLIGGRVTVNGATLTAPAGTIHVVSAAGAGQVPVNPRNRSALTVSNFGAVSIKGGALLDVSDPVNLGSGGSIYVRSGGLKVDDSEINADNYGSGSGGNLLLRADRQIDVTDGAYIHAVAVGAGNGANIALTTGTSGSITVDQSSLILSGTVGTGAGGTIGLSGSQINIDSGAEIISFTAGPGNSGNIDLTASGALTIDGSLAFGINTGIGSVVQPGATGNGGAINAQAPGLMTITGGGIISSETAGAGNGGAISVTAGTLAIDAAVNQVPFGGIVSLVDSAGTVTIFANPGNGTGQGGNIAVQAGQLALTSGGVIQTTSFGTGNSGPIGVSVSGTLSIDGGASIFSATDFGIGNGGAITLDARNLSIADEGSIAADSAGAGNAGAITIAVPGAVTIDGAGTEAETGVFSDAVGSGNGANITLSASSMSLIDGGQILTSTSGPGNAGSIAVTTTGALSIDGFNLPIATGIVSAELPGSTGSAGAVTVDAASLAIANNGSITNEAFGAADGGPLNITVLGQLTIDGGTNPQNITGIFSNTGIPPGAATGGTITISAGSLSLTNGGSIGANTSGGGNAGDVNISAGTLSLTDGSSISTDSFSSGAGGTVLINVPGFISISGSNISSDTNGAGNAGSVTVNSGSLTIADAGEISGSTDGAGNGGAVNVNVSGLLFIDGSFEGSGIAAIAGLRSTGNAGNATVTAGSLTIINGGEIASNTFGPGNGGLIDVVAGTLSLSDFGEIGANVEPGSSGHGGSLGITAGNLSISDGGAISSSSFGTGTGGDVVLNVSGPLSVTDGGTIDGITTGAGNGGNIRVTANSIELSGYGPFGLPSAISASADPGAAGSAGGITVYGGSITIGAGGQISSTTDGSGSGGAIGITGGTILLTGIGPQISAQSFGTGDAGSITVDAGNLTLTHGASISTEAAQANGGDIDLHIGNLLLLVDSEISTSVNGASGNGGNILIDPPFVVLDSSRIIADAIGGNGGNIDILAGEFIASPDSLVQASSQLGISGTIDIESQIVEINGALAPLADDLRAVTAVARNNCAARGDQPRSSLVSAGRGGLTQDPDTALPSFYLAGQELHLGHAEKAESRGEPSRLNLAALTASTCE